MARQTRVYSVDNVQLSLSKSNPPQLMVTAFGMTAQAGWSDVRLDLLESELSADGILDLVFVGTPPGGISFPVLTPVIAHYVWEDAERIVGVTVHARSNAMSRLLDQRGGMTTLALGEEGPPNTERVGEDAAPEGATAAFKINKSLAAGEEHGTINQIGSGAHSTTPIAEELPPSLFPFTTQPYFEEHPIPVPQWEIPAGVTTMIHGEEHGPTTMVAGEEGTHAVGESPTFFPGEHGHSLPIAENPSTYWAEHPTFVAENWKPQPDPWSNPGQAGAFGSR